MAKKNRSSKKRKSKPGKRQSHPNDDNRAKSFGSGLDEVGFQPLGHRIIISRRPQRVKQPKRRLPPDAEPSLSDFERSSHDDPLGYDTSDPSYPRKMAEDAMSGAHEEQIEKEIDAALRRWKIRD